jgi:MYXO-CTERM domain-containing protein
MRYRNDLAANGAKVSLAAAVLLLGAAFLRQRR